MSQPLHVVYCGNFGEHNTETHIARALEVNGHTVDRVQENTATAFVEAADRIVDLATRRESLWTKAGVGLALPEFQRAVEVEAIGHVGLAESATLAALAGSQKTPSVRARRL